MVSNWIVFAQALGINRLCQRANPFEDEDDDEDEYDWALRANISLLSRWVFLQRTLEVDP
jgi:hypothetical protein